MHAERLTYRVSEEAYCALMELSEQKEGKDCLMLSVMYYYQWDSCLSLQEDTDWSLCAVVRRRNHQLYQSSTDTEKIYLFCLKIKKYVNILNNTLWKNHLDGPIMLHMLTMRGEHLKVLIYIYCKAIVQTGGLLQRISKV